MKLAALRRPLAWGMLSAVTLGVAVSLSARAPGWLFWGCIALSCLGAAAATLLRGPDERT